MADQEDVRRIALCGSAARAAALIAPYSGLLA